MIQTIAIIGGIFACIYAITRDFKIARYEFEIKRMELLLKVKTTRLDKAHNAFEVEQERRVKIEQEFDEYKKKRQIEEELTKDEIEALRKAQKIQIETLAEWLK